MISRSVEAHRKFHYDAVIVTNAKPENALAAIGIARKELDADRYILISSDLVYTPSNDPKAEDSRTEPITDEGRIFLTAESLMNQERDAIFRTGFIIGLCSVNLYTNVLNMVRSGMRLSLSKSTIRNFIRNADLSSFIMRSIERNISGVYNVASDASTAYDFAKRLCDMAGLKCTLEDSGEDLGNYTMDTSRSLKTFGMRPMSVFEGYTISGSFDLR
ncbi:NAD-dependent epimerase/dehydratase family protein [Thermoplasma acidophilum]|uniref:NAD-dependent epimerase/dehydratase family protein n=1 Tax=Thermoplasma acidophilum TaxID=2303 RepID=UPI00064F425E|nr:sugar nucleotide-binding protein [Thermoplasma acidophilum]